MSQQNEPRNPQQNQQNPQNPGQPQNRPGQQPQQQQPKQPDTGPGRQDIRNPSDAEREKMPRRDGDHGQQR